MKLDLIQANKLGSTIESEIHSLTNENKRSLLEMSYVTPQNRLDELIAFQGWMEFANKTHGNPYIRRAQVITQNYICFVYLGDALFKSLKAVLPPPLVTGRCCRFLLSNPVRAFRNAIAHSNWRYKENFSGLEFWARKGSEPEEPLVHFEVQQDELGYWQALSRCVAYSAYMVLKETLADQP
jgi:hypothetical protein